MRRRRGSFLILVVALSSGSIPRKDKGLNAKPKAEEICLLFKVLAALAGLDELLCRVKGLEVKLEKTSFME